eukprot:6281442-Amphidinium_carterae.2
MLALSSTFAYCCTLFDHFSLRGLPFNPRSMTASMHSCPSMYHRKLQISFPDIRRPRSATSLGEKLEGRTKTHKRLAGRGHPRFEGLGTACEQQQRDIHEHNSKKRKLACNDFCLNFMRVARDSKCLICNRFRNCLSLLPPFTAFS